MTSYADQLFAVLLSRRLYIYVASKNSNTISVVCHLILKTSRHSQYEIAEKGICPCFDNENLNIYKDIKNTFDDK